MFFHHKYLPSEYDSFFVIKKEPFEMPNEKAFSITLTYYADGQQHNWKRIWYVPELEIKLMEVELGEASSGTINDITHEQLFRFKKDISLYLKHMNLKLAIKNKMLCLVSN